MATGYGVGAFLFLFSSQSLLMGVTKCMCFGRPLAPGSNRAWSIIYFASSWWADLTSITQLFVKTSFFCWLNPMLQADLLSCIIMPDSWSNKECIPYKVQARDLRSELDLRVPAQRSVHCWSSLCGIHHDPQCLLLHVLCESHESSFSKNQQGELNCWNGWVCLKFCCFCSFKPNGRH